MTKDKSPNPVRLPLVVQLGFAGSRRLLDTTQYPNIDINGFEAEVETWLANRLRQLRLDLDLDSRHFFCGISAIAIGGDTIFCRACRKNEIPLRIFLPQTRDEFIKAEGSTGPDFPTQIHKDQVLSILDSSQVIQERLVSDSSKRDERFIDVNQEIIRVSDVLICLLRKGAQGQSGGTGDMIERAVLRGKPVLVIEIEVADGRPIFREMWKLPKGSQHLSTYPAKAFQLPKPPRTLAGVELSVAAPGIGAPIETYTGTVKQLSSETAAKMQVKFKSMAKIIIVTHIIATIVASVALGFEPIQAIRLLLALELIMLATGIGIHERLHRTRTSHAWAEARLLAEVTRSVQAVGNLHVYLEYLFTLPFPREIRPVLRTINVLHLQSTRLNHTPWEQKRDQYVETRLMIPRSGQIDFYTRRTNDSKRLFNHLHVAFYMFWLAAFFSTALKLALHDYLVDWMQGVMGTLAIVMPVLAAASLSLAAALDLEAQEHTYREILVFLERQKQNLNSAKSEREYARLVIEIESQLLGETANWFSRRSFATVA